jgi:hypothetical protein
MDYESTPEFDANFLKLTSKNKALKVRLHFRYSLSRAKIIRMLFDSNHLMDGLNYY